MKKTIHKGFAWVMALCMLLTLLPVSALAANEAGGLSVAGGSADDYEYNTTSKVLTIKSGTALTISGTTTEDTIVVVAGVTANITLSGVSITTADTATTSPVSIPSPAAVNLTLAGANTLASGNMELAALHVPEGAALTIGGEGSLTATVAAAATDDRFSSYAAAIGGNGHRTGTGETAGSITINSGTVTAATSGNQAYGAGIGGGGGNDGGAGGAIRITGGTINARCGDADAAENFGGGAGIGGGTSGAGGTINISGGIVNANCGSESHPGKSGAGIGGGANGAGGRITITGGTVTAKGGQSAAGIGGGNNGTGGTIVIGTEDAADNSSPVVNASVLGTGGQSAGIGSGYIYLYGNTDSDAYDITIHSGTVTAAGGAFAAGGSEGGPGIGGNGNDSGGIKSITITGGEVTATGSVGSAGIGGNTSSDSAAKGSMSITISGGNVTAAGCAAGIGGKKNADDVRTITVSGGTVDARAAVGSYSSEGAGIGGGSNAETSVITITGSAVIKNAMGSNGAGIGGSGYSYSSGNTCYGDGGKIVISGNASIGLKDDYTAEGAKGSQGGAGIGGGPNGNGGTIEISTTGYVEAMGNYGGAGIGGGATTRSDLNGGNGGSITISNGTVTARGSYMNGACGAGIGGGGKSAGIGGDGGTINISGGNIVGQGVIDCSNLGGSACIGGGNNGSGGTISISGGNLLASNQYYDNDTGYTGDVPALIGGGTKGCSGTISISGGTVHFAGDPVIYVSDTNHIGHGESYGGTDGSVTITGGSVTAGAAYTADAQVRPEPKNGSDDKVYRVSMYLTNTTGDNVYLDHSIITALTITDSGSHVYPYGINGIDLTNGCLDLWLPVGTYTATGTVRLDQTFYNFEGPIRIISAADREGTLSANRKYTETISLNIGADLVTYNKTNRAPTATVTNAAGDTLTKDTDYTLSFEKVSSLNDVPSYQAVTEIINAGSYRITATGKPGTAYEGMSESKEFHVNPKHVATTYDGDAITKEYDGDTVVKDSSGNAIGSLALTVSGGVIDGDSITNVTLEPEYAQAGVGANLTIHVSNVTCTGNENNNYTIDSPADLTGTITTRVIGASEIAQGDLKITKTYDGTTSSANATKSGSLVLTDLVGTEVAALSIDTYGDFSSKDVGEDKEVVVTFGSLDGANKDNYALADGATTFTATASITPADYSYTVTTEQEIPQGRGLSDIATPTGGAGVVDEIVPGTLTWYKDETRTQTAVDSDLGSLSVGTTVTLYLRFTASDSNYTNTAKTGSVALTIVAGDPQVVSFATPASVSKTYGEPAFTNLASNESAGGGAVTYQSSNANVAAVNANTGEVALVGAGTATITATAAAVTGTWAQTTASYTLTVNKKAVTVTADDKTKTYGTANPALTFTHTPADLVGGDRADDLRITLACNATATSPAGTPVAITGTSASANYTVTVTPGELTITKADQQAVTVTLSSATAVKGLAVPTLTAAGGNGTGVYSYAGGDAGVATIDPATGIITVVGAGATAFTATKTADTNYNVSSASSAVTLTVKDKATIAARDTKATTPALVTHLKNQGKISVGAVTRVGLTNEFNLAVAGTSALSSYASSNEAQGTAKWIGLLIGNFKINDGAEVAVTDLYYKSTADGSYTRLTATDAQESSDVGATDKEMVLWIKTDVTPTRTIWLAYSESGAHETKLTISFAAYIAPPAGGGDGGTPPSTPVTTENGDKTTVTTTVTGTTNSAGTASAAVKSSDVSSLIKTAKAAEADHKNAVIEIKVETTAGAKAAEVTIPKAAFDSIASETKADVKINTGIGTLTFDPKAIETIAAAAVAGDISIEIKTLDSNKLPENAKKLVGDRPVYDFSVSAGDTQVSGFGGGTASLGIPYTLKPGEDENAVVVYYIDDSGAVQSVRGAYHAETGTVDFTVSHFSQYAVGYNKVSFADVSATAWYADAVTFISARGITKGTSPSAFSPDAAMTRGQFLVMLMRAYGIESSETLTENFADAGNTYYTTYLATAKKLGITNGVGGNLFMPEAEITRQDMFALLYRALDVMGALPAASNNGSLSDFADAAAISDYAKTAVGALVSCGIVSGSNGRLAPAERATRAEMAQLLYNLLSK